MGGSRGIQEATDAGASGTVQERVCGGYGHRAVHVRYRGGLRFARRLLSLDLYYAAAIPDYAEKQSDLIFDYQTNVTLYPAFQKYLREHRPPLLAVWGRMTPHSFGRARRRFAGTCPRRRSSPWRAGTSRWRTVARRLRRKSEALFKTIGKEKSVRQNCTDFLRHCYGIYLDGMQPNGSVIIEYHAILHLCRSVFLNLQPYRCDLLSTQRDSAKHSAKVFCCNLSM